MFANGERMSYANKLCIHTGAVMSFKPRFNYVVPAVVS